MFRLNGTVTRTVTLHVDGVSRGSGGVRAVEDVTFAVRSSARSGGSIGPKNGAQEHADEILISGRFLSLSLGVVALDWRFARGLSAFPLGAAFNELSSTSVYFHI